MKKAIRVVAALLSGFVVFVLVLDGFVGLSQPPLRGADGILRTFDADGTVHERRLALIDDGEQVWVASIHHFRQWYYRALDNPEVELLRNGKTRSYRAIPVDTPESKAFIEETFHERTGSAIYYFIKAARLFAELKALRLEPL